MIGRVADWGVVLLMTVKDTSRTEGRPHPQGSPGGGQVVNYLKGHHSVQKMGWVTRRKVTPIGLGTGPPPVPERDPLPAPRVEVLVFVPQG